MNNEIRERYLKLALVVSGIAFLLIYPLGALYDSREHGHLVGDVPALLLVAFVLWFLSPTSKVASRAAV